MKKKMRYGCKGGKVDDDDVVGNCWMNRGNKGRKRGRVKKKGM
jgi:hypothetical protein